MVRSRTAEYPCTLSQLRGAILKTLLHISPPDPILGVGPLCNLIIQPRGPHMPIRSHFSPRRKFFTCAICNEFVELETTNVDETGKPVHEECYLQRISLKRSIRPPPTLLEANLNDDTLSHAIITLLNSTKDHSVINSCPECGSQLEYRDISLFYSGQTWEVHLPLCLNCPPICNSSPPDN